MHQLKLFNFGISRKSVFYDYFFLMKSVQGTQKLVWSEYLMSQIFQERY